MANSSERSSPILACNPNTHLRFDGRNLYFYSSSGTKIFPATSGKRGYDFSLEAQKDHGKGVIPSGNYWINPSQLWTAKWYHHIMTHLPVLHAYPDGWGWNRITIHEMPNTQTYGRGGFFIHGGIHEGSAGCIHIINMGGMENFLNTLKNTLGGIPKCSIQLIVSYPNQD